MATEPFTTMSIPFMEMPQREGVAVDAQQPAAPGGARRRLASPSTWTKPDIMFSATPTPALPWIRTVACLFIPAQ